MNKSRKNEIDNICEALRKNSNKRYCGVMTPKETSFCRTCESGLEK